MGSIIGSLVVDKIKPEQLEDFKKEWIESLRCAGNIFTPINDDHPINFIQLNKINESDLHDILVKNTDCLDNGANVIYQHDFDKVINDLVELIANKIHLDLT